MIDWLVLYANFSSISAKFLNYYTRIAFFLLSLFCSFFSFISINFLFFKSESYLKKINQSNTTYLNILSHTSYHAKMYSTRRKDQTQIIQFRLPSLLFTWLIDWCFMPTLAVFQLYRGVHYYTYIDIYWNILCYFLYKMGRPKQKWQIQDSPRRITSISV
jgi:hypothetical protein